jgi:hypothetical protein
MQSPYAAAIAQKNRGNEPTGAPQMLERVR